MSDWDYNGEPDWERCDCPDGGWYDANKYSSCYQCFADRREGYVDCILCGRRWHDPEYPTCYACRGTRDNAAADLRALILHRDGYRCRDCDSHTDLQVDHLMPCARGGTADPWNLQVLCGQCNRDKGYEWWPGCRWDRRRRQQLGAYFVGLRDFLDDDSQQRLRDEVDRLRWGDEIPDPVVWRTDWSQRAEALFEQMEADIDAGIAS